MKNIVYLFIVVVLAGMYACEPRIDLDEGQWGDHAFIDNAKLFRLDADEHELQEFYTSGTLTPAVKRIYVSGDAEIDKDNLIATITVSSDVDLSMAGIVIFHKAVKVEPLNGAPIAGILNNFSSGSFQYRLHSADGSTHDWTINIIK